MSKIKTKAKSDGTEPLSAFQDTSVTGRKDAAPKEKKQAGKKQKPADKEKDTPPATIPAKIEEPVRKAQIAIQKVRVIDDNFLSISYNKLDLDGTHSEHPNEGYPERFMHKDLRGKLRALIIHMALASGYIPKAEVKNINRYNQDLIKSFSIHTVTIKANEGVILSGLKKTDFKAVTNVNTPFTRLGAPENSPYSHVEDLQEKLDELLEEVTQYLLGTKVGENPQGSLDLKEPGEEPYVDEAI